MSFKKKKGSERRGEGRRGAKRSSHQDGRLCSLPRFTCRVERGRLKLCILGLIRRSYRRIDTQSFEVRLLLAAAAGGEGVISRPRPRPRNNKLERFFMGQRSHMLPEPLCLSNWLCQSMNLAPHATEEWDSGSPHPMPHTHSSTGCVRCVCTRRAAHCSAYERSHCLATAGQLETAPYLHLEDEWICSSKTEAYCAALFKLSAEWRLLCQIPHRSSAFNTVWPSNTHVFARSLKSPCFRQLRALKPR